MTTPNLSDDAVIQGLQASNQSVEQPVVTESAAPSGGAPYDSYVAKFPEELHPVAREIFKEWDAGVSKRFEGLHSEVKQYKDTTETWQDVIQNSDPDSVRQAVALAQAIEQNPEAVLRSMADAFSIDLTNGQGTGEPVDSSALDDADITSHPKFKELEQGLGTIAEILLEQRRKEEDDANEKALNNLLSDMEKQHGKFDTPYITFLLGQGLEPDQAIEQWKSVINEAASVKLTPGNDAPVVLGAGGGLPSNQVEVSKLSDSDTRRAVAAILEAANRET